MLFLENQLPNLHGIDFYYIDIIYFIYRLYEQLEKGIYQKVFIFSSFNISTFFLVFHDIGSHKPEVAGSIGPYGACQHDGSEYHGNYVDSMTEQVS